MKVLADGGASTKQGNVLTTWAMRMNSMMTDLLTIGGNSSVNSLAVLGNIDVENHKETFRNS